MDHAAKLHLLQMMLQRPPRLYKISGEPWLSGLDPANSGRSLQGLIQDVTNGPRSLAYRVLDEMRQIRQGRFKYSQLGCHSMGNERSIDHANWDATAWAMKEASITRRHLSPNTLPTFLAPAERRSARRNEYRMNAHDATRLTKMPIEVLVS
jgi:hypothetical protein